MRHHSNCLARRQAGAHTVEMALTALAFFTILFGVIEFSRAMWMWSMLGEATRRGARVAAVCDLNDPKIYTEATVMPSSLTADNIEVEYDYLPATPGAAWVTGISGEAAAAAPGPIRDARETLVRVRIVNYIRPFAFIYGHINLTAPAFETTLPGESLGWNPATRSFQPCP